MESMMIEIREVLGRYEVYSSDRHWEVFDAKLAAEAVALALAAEIQQELGRLPTIISPWPVYSAMTGGQRPAACGLQDAGIWGPLGLRREPQLMLVLGQGEVRLGEVRLPLCRPYLDYR